MADKWKCFAVIATKADQSVTNWLCCFLNDLANFVPYFWCPLSQGFTLTIKILTRSWFNNFFLPLSVYLFSSLNLVYHSHKTGSTSIPIYKNFLSVHGRIWTCTLCIISLVWELLSIFLYIYVLSNNLHLNYFILLIQYCNQEALSNLLL